jgi:hypothetical protein
LVFGAALVAAGLAFALALNLAMRNLLWDMNVVPAYSRYLECSHYAQATVQRVRSARDVRLERRPSMS